MKSVSKNLPEQSVVFFRTRSRGFLVLKKTSYSEGSFCEQQYFGKRRKPFLKGFLIHGGQGGI